MTTFYVGFAGVIGALCRYGLSSLANPSQAGSFPWGTLACNWIGSFILGFLSYVLLKRLTDQLRVVITTGFIGSFTTFSTFSWETVQFMELGQYGAALLYVMISVIGGLGLCYLGVQLAERGRNKEVSTD
ncbi:fluoride efflux transporter CrcB [Paenibacillus sp. N1-5-1-14]|uniref:fluoride efflux transporter CrcB n=1 Tax=Paenibacillus radicibacter TaxID=2972488 RepID=UPI0021594FB6|nr:fluoride efflux transporter CrcB [Paenibacillus radicibacter]MCR8641850.1 fluoride efflux transporter CrcB [Paenibacillus radicibacter]